MTIATVTTVMPHQGKYSLCLQNILENNEYWKSLGNKSYVNKELFGGTAGSLSWVSMYENFSDATAKIESGWENAGFKRIIRRIQTNPASDVVFPMNMVRTVYGDWDDTYKFTLFRLYNMKRNKMAEALDMLPKVAKMGEKMDVNVTAWVPVTGEDMSTIMVGYSSKTFNEVGRSFDTIGMSEEFQQIVNKAAEIGELQSAWIVGWY